MGNQFKKLQMTDMYLADKAAYDAAVKASSEKVLCIDFTATWCPPCKMIGPKFEAMASEFTNVIFKKCDVDANKETASHVGIQCMPTFKFFKNGSEIEGDKLEGANEAKLKELIQKHN